MLRQLRRPAPSQAKVRKQKNEEIPERRQNVVGVASDGFDDSNRHDGQMIGEWQSRASLTALLRE
jgi:hypothetical protein